ncbi:MAG: hypothetical protein U9N82_05560 [Thermodesulfobacteriota bacterium]|nr:hypothetical protein [Thermodesulfobacteriota bacterium]
MSEVRILKTDSRGRITLPPVFRKEPLFEYVIEGQQLTLYPVQTVRKFPDMLDLPVEELSPEWIKKEDKVNKDTRQGVMAATPAQALKHLKK